MRTLRKLLVVFAIVAMLTGVVGTFSAAAQTPQPEDFYTWVFSRTWARTDLVVSEGTVNRTWMWGPKPETGGIQEDYVEAPGGVRTVQYFDKSRMEENTWRDPAPEEPWDVTNGRLAFELIKGEMQLGDDTFEQYCPSTVNIVGDPVDVNVTYASFNKLILGGPSLASGDLITQTVDKAGNVSSDSSLSQYGVTELAESGPTRKSIASVFWEFMNSSGPIFDANIGEYGDGPLFVNPFYATGYPISEAYWTQAVVAGSTKWVLVQAFERRVMTYTPDNPSGWQVEAGNVGQHYYRWRHNGEGLTDCDDGEGNPPPPPPPDEGPEACSFPAPVDLGAMPSKVIEEFVLNELTHRLFDPDAFVAPLWGGADSWHVTTTHGPNSGGAWRDDGKFSSGRIEYRGTENHIQWCLGVLTTQFWDNRDLMAEFLVGAEGPVAINIRIKAHSVVTVVGPLGTYHQATSDGGDITIILQPSAMHVIAVDYTMDASTHESLVEWGPYDRCVEINTIDTRFAPGQRPTCEELEHYKAELAIS